MSATRLAALSAPVTVDAVSRRDARPQHELVDAPAIVQVVAAPAPAEPVRAAVVEAAPVVDQQDFSDGLASEYKARVTAALYEVVGSRLNDPSMSDEAMRALVRRELAAIVAEDPAPLSSLERQQLIAAVENDTLGLGPLEALLADERVTEIMVNGPDMVYAERGGKLQLTGTRFTSEQHLRGIIERIVSRVGRRIDESSPLVDARLLDGSRVHAVIPPLAYSGSTLTIRKFAKDPFKVADLIKFGTMTPAMAEFLRGCVEADLNIIVSGGTGTGKTTLLNVLSSFIPEGERIITIEDAVELQLQQQHLVRLESRPSNAEGKGEITIRELVKNSLRMRPDRIVVGEVRSGETLDMLQAMNTGHDGSLSTVHANTPRDAVARLETLVLMAGMDLPLRAIREQIASAVHVIVQLSRLRDGTRRITHVTEVQGMEGDVVVLQDVFKFDFEAGMGQDGRHRGTTRATGIRPKFASRFEDHGIHMPADVFSADREMDDR